MSVNRILILVAVLVVVLYVITLAIGSRPRGGAVAWVSKLNNWQAAYQKLDLQNDVKTAAGLSNGVAVSSASRWSNGLWTIPMRVTKASLEISPSNKSIRKARLSLAGNSRCSIEYQPRPDAKKPGQPADDIAVPVVITNFGGQRPTLDLTFLRHGGVLTLTIDRWIGTNALELRLE